MMDQIAEYLRSVLAPGPEAIQSAGPGGGPQDQRKGVRDTPGVLLPPEYGRKREAPRLARATDKGYGGPPDPIQLDSPSELGARVQDEIADSIERARGQRIKEPKRERLRFMHPFSAEAHIDNDWRHAVGIFSLFDGTAGAPSAGNSLQAIPITLPSGAVSPLILLNRYPGAQYVNLYIRSVSFVPTAATATGLQELFFQDIGGAVVALGTYSAASQTGCNYQSVGALCTTPLTDPGNSQIGTLFVNNISIVGPVTARWQLGIGFMFMTPDPWFNEQVAIPPTPAEIAQALRSIEA